MTIYVTFGRHRVSPLSPEQAVQMQQAGTDMAQIALHFHISAIMLNHWFGWMGYDPLAFHADAICEAVAAGKPLMAAMAAVGLPYATQYGDRARALLEERAVTRRWAQRDKSTAQTCESCGIILEPYDPANIEQQSWQNGTRDGEHCTRCESGRGRLTRMPLPAPEVPEPVNLREVFRYAG